MRVRVIHGNVVFNDAKGKRTVAKKGEVIELEDAEVKQLGKKIVAPMQKAAEEK